MVSKSKTLPTQDPAVPFQVQLLTNGQRCIDVHSGIALWLKQPGSPRQQESGNFWATTKVPSPHAALLSPGQEHMTHEEQGPWSP